MLKEASRRALSKLGGLVARLTKTEGEREIFIVGGYNGKKFTQSCQYFAGFIPEGTTRLAFGEHYLDQYYERVGDIFLPVHNALTTTLELDMTILAGSGVYNPEAAVVTNYTIFGKDKNFAKVLYDFLRKSEISTAV